MEMPDLLPCPFCGKQDIEIRDNDGIVWEHCLSCDATGPTGHYRDDDCLTWNDRPDTTILKAKDARIAELETYIEKKRIGRAEMKTTMTPNLRGDFKTAMTCEKYEQRLLELALNTP